MARMLYNLIWLSQLLSVATSLSFCQRDMSTLNQLIVVFRHGDRNPESTFPTDIWQEDSWPLGWGELTPRGVARHFLYGQWMRSCYGSFLNETLNTQRVYVRSTDIDRTLMSAQAHLTGAYPPHGYQIWGQNMNISLGKLWQPFPVHTVPISEDGLMQAQKNCVRYTEGVQEAYNSSQVLALEQHDAAILKFLGEKSGLNTTDLYTLTRAMSDPVIVEMQNNRTLVDWLQNNRTLTERLEQYFNLWFQLTYNNPEMAKLSGGPLLQAIVDNMVNRSMAGSAQTNYEHIIYSGHDTTVAAILSSLGDFNNIAPPYTASVIFELHKTDKNYAVVVYYRNSTDSVPSDPMPVHIANCTGFMETGCSLDDFMKAVATKVTRNHLTDCLSGRTTPPTPLDLETILIVVGVTVGLMIMTIALAIFLKYLRRRPRDELLIDPGVN